MISFTEGYNLLTVLFGLAGVHLQGAAQGAISNLEITMSTEVRQPSMV